MRKTGRSAALLSALIIISIMLTSCSPLFISNKANLSGVPRAEDIIPIDTPEVIAPEAPERLDFGIENVFDPSGALADFYPFVYDIEYVTVATTVNNTPLFPTTESFIDACLYDRNSTLEAKYGFTFSALKDKSSALIKDFENAIKNNTFSADLLAVPVTEVSSFESKTVLRPISSLPFVNSSEEWMTDPETFGISGEYFMACEASLVPSRTRVIFFNEELVSAIKAKSPYTLLESGKWTWEALIERLGKHGKIATGDDLDALIEATASSSLAYGSVTDNAEGAESTQKAEKLASIKETLTKALVTEDAKKKFIDGEAYFYIGTLADIADITSQETVFGLLPIPVFEKGDKYIDVHNASDVTVYACPKSVADTERSALLLAAIAAASEGSRAHAFSQILDNALLRNNGSRLSLGYIFSADTKIIS